MCRPSIEGSAGEAIMSPETSMMRAGWLLTGLVAVGWLLQVIAYSETGDLGFMFITFCAALVIIAIWGSHPPIDPEQARNPISEKSPESFTLVSGPTWTTGDEPCLLLVDHSGEVSAWP